MQMKYYKKSQQGMVTIVVSLLLTLIISISVLLVAKTSLLEYRTSANEFEAEQAFEAAQAGLQFAVPYLIANKAAIVQDANNDGYIDNYSNSSTNNVALDNGTYYTISYSNPTQNNLRLIRIQAVGTSASGNISKTVTQLVQYYNAGVAHPGTASAVVKGSASIGGSVTIANTTSNNLTVYAGNNVSFTGSSQGVTSLGSSNNPSSSTSGVSMNNSTLVNASNAAFFQNFFGASQSTVQASADLHYTGNGNYSSILNGVTGKIIWIDGDVTLDSNALVGSLAEPVILIVNGNLSISGTFGFFGFLYVTQDWNNGGMGNADLYGALAVAGNFTSTGRPDIVYDPTVVNNLTTGREYYAVVPGSWRDF